VPHIKSKPISGEELKVRAGKYPDIIEFVARSANFNEFLLSIKYENENFLLIYKYNDNEGLLKFEKITRPLKLAILKEAIKKVSELLELDIVSSNIENIYNKKNPLFASKYYKKIEDFHDIEFEFDKVAIEVGFGSGRHILYQANQNQDTLYIGIEIHTPSAQQLLKQIEIQDLKNVWVVNYDARLFLEMIPSNIAKQIFVHFPVPWDKKPNRRVISADFVSEAMRVLDVDGTLELRTDSDLYYRYSVDVFSSFKKAKIHIQKNFALPIISKYEARWQRQEKDIYDVIMVCDEKSQKLDNNFLFSFDKMSYNINMADVLPRESNIYKGFFVHFERFYMIDNGSVVIRCAFGDFARPEHKYIVLNKEKCYYYHSEPIGSRANFNAHNMIKELLNA
jgi:tRNA (guanine-N7-)-methyltransferase